VVIELLKFAVEVEKQADFIQKDHEIWTKALSEYPWFIHKEVWINPEKPQEIVIVIWMRSRQEWKSIPQEKVEEIQKQFDEAIGPNYRLIEGSDYDQQDISTLNNDLISSP
jgi:uncharacterized protein (TIGR03792 family)